MACNGAHAERQTIVIYQISLHLPSASWVLGKNNKANDDDDDNDGSGGDDDT